MSFKPKDWGPFPWIFFAAALIGAGYTFVKFGQDIHRYVIPAACSAEIITSASDPQHIKDNKSFANCLVRNEGQPIDIALSIDASDLNTRTPMCPEIASKFDLEDKAFDPEILGNLYPMPIDESCTTVILLPDATNWNSPGTGLFYGSLEGKFAPRDRQGGSKGVFTVWSLTAP